MELSNRTTQRVLEVNSRLLVQVIQMYQDKKKMMTQLRKQKGRIEKLQIEQKALLVLVSNLKATISDLSDSDKKLLLKTLRLQLDKNKHGVIKLERIRLVTTMAFSYKARIFMHYINSYTNIKPPFFLDVYSRAQILNKHSTTSKLVKTKKLSKI